MTSLVASFHFAQPGWLITAIPLAILALGVSWWMTRRISTRPMAPRWGTMSRWTAVVLIVLSLADPRWETVRGTPGENLWIVLRDTSASLSTCDDGTTTSHTSQLNSLFHPENALWLQRLEQQFDVRNFEVDTTLRPKDSTSPAMTDSATNQQTRLYTALRLIHQRFAKRPVAGVIVFTDGHATDQPLSPLELAALPPVYPVLIGTEDPRLDFAIRGTSLSGTPFEDSPLTLEARIAATGTGPRSATAILKDAQGQTLQEQPVRFSSPTNGTARFQWRPASPGLGFCTVSVRPDNGFVRPDNGQSSQESPETHQNADQVDAIPENNQQLLAVEQGGAPLRILYVSGRPNWEFKFLRRALATDKQISVTGLIRIARKQSRLEFLGRAGERTNALFRGFDQVDAATAETDQPVFVRLGTRNPEELREGFPTTADELFAYQAIVIDDMEAAFFTPAQQELISQFVSERGGGLLMLGGQESFRQGGYAKTPLSRALPVYLEGRAPPLPQGPYRLQLTREGWLQPWVRLRSTEPAEQERLALVPEFSTLNAVVRLKPAALNLYELADSTGQLWPALVAQPYGRGRVAALLLGDWFHWPLGVAEDERKADDAGKAWRQLIRWVTADVPGKVELFTRDEVLRAEDVVASNHQPLRQLEVRVRTADYQPLAGGQVEVQATLPDGSQWTQPADPALREPGLFELLIPQTQVGPYQVVVTAFDEQGKPVETQTTGWAYDPAAQESVSGGPNRQEMAALAARTGGRLVEPTELQDFTANLSEATAPVMERVSTSLWNHWLVLGVIVVGLCVDWWLRRRKGLA